MAQRKIEPPGGPSLFELQERERLEQKAAVQRRVRRQRAMFIPRLLTETAVSFPLAGATRDAAYEIALRWADLETTGHLPQYKERSIAGSFLDEFFGAALGYKIKTASPDDWQLEHEFYVKEVGPARRRIGKVSGGKSARRSHRA